MFIYPTAIDTALLEYEIYSFAVMYTKVECMSHHKVDVEENKPKVYFRVYEALEFHKKIHEHNFTFICKDLFACSQADTIYLKIFKFTCI